MTRARALVAGAAAVALAGCTRTIMESLGFPKRAVVPPSLVSSLVCFERKARGDAYNWDGAYGSGFAVASGAWGTRILTAGFVVHGAYHFHLVAGGRRGTPATVVAVDNRNLFALLEIDAVLPPVRLGSARGLRPGTELVVAGFSTPDASGTPQPDAFFERIEAVVADREFHFTGRIAGGHEGGPVVDPRTGVVVGIGGTNALSNGTRGLGWTIDAARSFLAAHPR
ncbi:MAG: trypsin-like peptidase domain-containing protein [Candidatus Eremiobacteraeota bacterium]|nr:trypsin-like peptidase domain-containing protein [Candidatus Eremiobacteraeota bacterium]